MSIYAADSMLRIECYLQLSLAEIRSCTYLLIFAQVSLSETVLLKTSLEVVDS